LAKGELSKTRAQIEQTKFILTPYVLRAGRPIPISDHISTTGFIPPGPDPAIFNHDSASSPTRISSAKCCLIHATAQAICVRTCAQAGDDFMIRSRVKNELQHLMMNQGEQKKYKLRSVQGRTELEQLPLQHWADRRREDLLGLLKMLDQQTERMDQAVTTTMQHSKAGPDVITSCDIVVLGVGVPVKAPCFVTVPPKVARRLATKRSKSSGET
jgi:hypothetical protein